MSSAITKDKGTVFFKGAIDGSAQYGAVQPVGGTLTLDVKGVNSINSVGVRNDLDFVASLRAAKVTYEDCPHVLVGAFLPREGSYDTEGCAYEVSDLPGTAPSSCPDAPSRKYLRLHCNGIPRHGRVPRETAPLEKCP